jgi:hypothetical protein
MEPEAEAESEALQPHETQTTSSIRTSKPFRSTPWRWLNRDTLEGLQDKRALLQAVWKYKPYIRRYPNGKVSLWNAVLEDFELYLRRVNDYRKPPAAATVQAELIKILSEFRVRQYQPTNQPTNTNCLPPQICI